MNYLSDDKLRDEIDQEHGPLLLFFEHEHVPACQWTAPHLAAVLAEVPGVRLVRIPAERHPDLCRRFQAPRVPHLSFVRAGKAQAGLTGVYTSMYMRQWLAAQMQQA